MFYLPDRDEMQEIDRRTIKERGIPGILLMERAAISILEEINARKDTVLPARVKCLIVVEGGNNGGTGSCKTSGTAGRSGRGVLYKRTVKGE